MTEKSGLCSRYFSASTRAFASRPTSTKLAISRTQAIADLAAEIIDQHHYRLAGKGLVQHLGGAHGRDGVADQGVGHGAETTRRVRNESR